MPFRYPDIPGYEDYNPPLPPPTPPQFPPQIEQWRPLAEKYFRSETDVNKFLGGVVTGESSGNPKAKNPTSEARGLVGGMPSLHPGVNFDDPEQAIKWSAEQVYDHGWSDWGEGTNYKGVNFGALGAPTKYGPGGTGSPLPGHGAVNVSQQGGVSVAYRSPDFPSSPYEPDQPLMAQEDTALRSGGTLRAKLLEDPNRDVIGGAINSVAGPAINAVTKVVDDPNAFMQSISPASVFGLEGGNDVTHDPLEIITSQQPNLTHAAGTVGSKLGPYFLPSKESIESRATSPSQRATLTADVNERYDPSAVGRSIVESVAPTSIADIAPLVAELPEAARGLRAVLEDVKPRIAASTASRYLPDGVLTDERAGAAVARLAGQDPLAGARARLSIAGGAMTPEEEAAAAASRVPLPGQGGLFGGVVDESGQIAPIEKPANPSVESLTPAAENPHAERFQARETARRKQSREQFPDANTPRETPGQAASRAEWNATNAREDAEAYKAIMADRNATPADVGAAKLITDSYTLNPEYDSAAAHARKLAFWDVADPEVGAAARAERGAEGARTEWKPSEKAGIPDIAAEQAKPQPLPPANGLARDQRMIRAGDLQFRPDLFQARDASPGKPYGESRVKQIVDNWDDAKFIPPDAVPDPENPGKLIVYSGHHRSEAFIRRFGEDAPIRVNVTHADIKDAAELNRIRGLARAANFDTAVPNFREAVRAAEIAKHDGLSHEAIAAELRITPSKVDELLDASRVGPSAVDRVVSEPTLEPYLKEIGRGMRSYGINTEDANGLFQRIATGTKASRPTPAALRETIDKFGAILSNASAQRMQGTMFAADEATGDKGGLLQLIDENSRIRTELNRARNAVSKAQTGANKLASLPNALPENKDAAARLVKLGADEKLRLDSVIARNEENLARAARGEPPLPEPEAPKPPSGRGGPPEQPPPPPHAPVPGDALDQLISHVESAGAMRPDLLTARRQELGKRIARAEERLKVEGAAPKDAMKLARQELKGQLADPSFTVPGDLDVDTLHQAILDSADAGVPFFTRSTATDALDKLAAGSIPAPHEVRALGQIFGPRLQYAIEELGDVFKVQKRVEEKLLREPLHITFPDNTPITPDRLAEILHDSIPEASVSTRQKVAERLIDSDKIKVTVNRQGKAMMTIGEGGGDGLGQAVMDFIEGMEPIDRLGGPGEVRGLDAPKSEFPPEPFPNVRGPERQPLVNATAQKPLSGPGLTDEQIAANKAARAQREAEWADAIDKMPIKKSEAVTEMTQAEYEQALRDLKANAAQLDLGPGIPDGWTKERWDAYRHLQYVVDRDNWQHRYDVKPPRAVTQPQLPPPGGSTSVQAERQYSFVGKDWKPGEPLINVIWKNINAIPSLPKALLSTLDRSAVLRQGGGLIRHGEQIKDAIAKTMIIAADEEHAARLEKIWGFKPPTGDEVMQPVLHGKWAQARQDAGLVIEDWGPNAKNPNEQFTSKLAHKLFGKLGSEMSERSYAVYLNKLRADVFDSVVEKWMRDGRSFRGDQFDAFASKWKTGTDLADKSKQITGKDLTDLANYLNATTGHGSLGQFEGAAKAMSQLWFSPRNLVSRFQTIEMLFDPRTSNLVRKEMAKDLAVYVGTGIALLSMADLSGLADVEMDPRSTDFGKMRIGNTRIDFWGGYQQIARYGAQLITGQVKSSTGTVYDADRTQIGLRYLRSKLSPSAGMGVDLLADDQMTGSKIDLGSVHGGLDFLYHTATPLFLQDTVDALRENGSYGLTTVPLSFFGVSTQTYQSPFEQRNDMRDSVAREKYGVNYNKLIDSFPDKGFTYQAEVNADPRVSPLNDKTKEASKNLPFGQEQEHRQQYADELNARREDAEQSFAKSDLPKSLPEIWSDISKEAAGARRQHEIDTGTGERKGSEFDKALNEYFDKTVLDSGVVDWDATNAKQDEYLASLPEKTRQQIENFLGEQEKKKSPLYREYKQYLRDRESQGYFEDGITQTQRDELDRQDPQLDATGWKFKGGVREKNDPVLQTPQAVDIALKMDLPGRDVRFGSLARPINQDSNSLAAWKESKDLMVWYDSKMIADNWKAEGARLAKSTGDKEYAKPLDEMEEQHRGTIKGNLHEAAKKGNKELDGYLYWWGAEKKPATQAGANYAHVIVDKYGSKTPASKKKQPER